MGAFLGGTEQKAPASAVHPLGEPKVARQPEQNLDQCQGSFILFGGIAAQDLPVGVPG